MQALVCLLLARSLVFHKNRMQSQCLYFLLLSCSASTHLEIIQSTIYHHIRINRKDLLLILLSMGYGSNYKQKEEGQYSWYMSHTIANLCRVLPMYTATYCDWQNSIFLTATTQMSFCFHHLATCG